MTAATDPGPRYPSLDVIRGVAVMGILLMNIVGFAMPREAYSNPNAYGGDGAVDIAVWFANFVLADGKMRGLFAVLFGASMLLIVDRAEAAQENPAAVHYSRMGWLFVFGAIHAYAIWYGDILMAYAAIGAVAFFFRHLETHRLFVLGLALIFGQAVYWGVTAAELWTLQQAALTPGAGPETVSIWREFAAQFGAPAPAEIARDLALYRGDYAGIIAERLGPDFWFPVNANLYSAFETLGLMLVGMAGLRSGFLTGAWERRRYLILAGWGYAIGIPLLALLAAALLAYGFSPMAVFLGGFALQTLINPLVILGHASLIVWWVYGGGGRRLLAAVAAAGRAAFTNYLGASLVMTTIFYGYGFGFYGSVGRAELYLFVFAAWAAMLIWSPLWLSRYRYGPFEWLWRSLARRKPQQMRKQASDAF